MDTITTLVVALLFIAVILILAGIATLFGAALTSILMTFAVVLAIVIPVSIFAYVFRPRSTLSDPMANEHGDYPKITVR